MGINIDISGIPQVKKYLKSKNKQVNTSLKKGITNATVFLQGEVKMSIAGEKNEPRSVDTGRFLNSVGFEVKDYDGKVFSNVPYAKKLEFGTDFKNSPRKHFTNSAARSKDKIIQLIKAQLSSV